jgi:hypothetical protein
MFKKFQTCNGVVLVEVISIFKLTKGSSGFGADNKT